MIAAASTVRQKHGRLLSDPKIARSWGNLYPRRLRPKRKPGRKPIRKLFTKAVRMLGSKEAGVAPREQVMVQDLPVRDSQMERYDT